MTSGQAFPGSGRCQDFPDALAARCPSFYAEGNVGADPGCDFKEIFFAERMLVSFGKSAQDGGCIGRAPSHAGT